MQKPLNKINLTVLFALMQFLSIAYLDVVTFYKISFSCRVSLKILWITFKVEMNKEKIFHTGKRIKLQFLWHCLLRLS